MEKKPKCRYCGSPMELQKQPHTNKYNYWCTKCYSESPVKDSMQKAFETAYDSECYLEPMKLTDVWIEQAVWLETRATGKIMPVVMIRETIKDEFDKEYGKRFRCWLRKPSRKQTASIKWEDETNAKLRS